ncbi:STAS domain-containing protein [Actinophytocola sp.]|uniref:STAS domain-containing protein n=1 Tax=Actinophytocola sp. TaxID=1872138 RepID=UPI002ED002EF
MRWTVTTWTRSGTGSRSCSPSTTRIVVDFSGVSSVSSASLRAMLLIYRQAQAIGCAVAVVGLSPEVHNVLEATGFLHFFVVAETVTDGVAAVRARTEGSEEREHATSGS